MQTNQPAPKMPPIRQDLSIAEGAAFWTGAPSWLIHDGLRNRFFRIGREAMQLLVNWRPLTSEKLAASISQKTSSEVKPEEVEEFARFLIANSLVVQDQENAWRTQLEQSNATRQVWWKRVVHNYLFFRVPLFRPQKFLDATWPAIAPLFTRTSAIIFLMLGIFSLYLVSRQWSVFVSTFLDFLSLEGFLLYAASLVFIKVIHEFGHAFMARKYKSEVAVIGVAFIVLMPILYTDTTSAHRLQDRRQRLNIDLAGIYAELALACVATFFWVFLPDGPLRSVAFSTATLSWVMSLAVNLNPFMRFDGYYILSDLAGFENLQERGFALAKWRLREVLFGLRKPAPEYLPDKVTAAVILHAWGTWIYRFFLFLGIALLVYSFFIKIVGIALFVIEICWFILLPIWRELKEWWALRKEIVMTRRSMLSGAVLFAFLLFLFVPWSSQVSMPAIAKTDGLVALFPADEGRVAEHTLENGRAVKAGEVLLVLSSPDLDEDLARVRAEINLLELRLSRLTADAQDQSLRLVLEQEWQSRTREQEGLLKLRDRLQIRAPVAGTLVNVDTSIDVNMWLNPLTRLAYVRPHSQIVISALADENARARVNPGNEGKFIPDNFQLEKIDVSVAEMGQAALQQIEEPLFTDLHGGHVAVKEENADGVHQLKPRKAWFPVRLTPKEEGSLPFATEHVLRGMVIVEGEAESHATRIGRRVASVLLREAGL